MHDHLMPNLLISGPPKSVIMQPAAYWSEFAKLARYGLDKPPPPRLEIASDMAGPTNESLCTGSIRELEQKDKTRRLRSEQDHLE